MPFFKFYCPCSIFWKAWQSPTSSITSCSSTSSVNLRNLFFQDCFVRQMQRIIFHLLQTFRIFEIWLLNIKINPNQISTDKRFGFYYLRGDNRARTCDPMRVMHVLSQLSYASTAYITTFLQKFNTVFPICYGRFFMAVWCGKQLVNDSFYCSGAMIRSW